MARKKAIPEPASDIPEWFMTYSDVITLLMTFFILLLTFSTTEPERFDRIQQTLFAGGKGSGIIGEKVQGPENDSFIQRVRPRSARMAIVGSEMSPYLVEPSTKSVGAGIKGLDKDAEDKDVMTTNQFDLEIDTIFTPQNKLNSKGMHLASMLSTQLVRLPVHMSLQCSNPEKFERATLFVTHLYHIEKIRPGQVGVSIVEGVKPTNVRFSLERFEN